MKHILIGGNGFVGRHTAIKLRESGEQVLICDLTPRQADLAEQSPSLRVDITDATSIASIPFEHDDIVYNFAARMLHPIVPRGLRHHYFRSVDYEGAVNVIRAMQLAGCRRLIQFSTDMVYGRPQFTPITTLHPRMPIGEYSASKKALEDYCIEQRRAGLNVSILRPRLIVGPGRLGVLARLFWMVQNDMPIPLIGSGRNRYQMVSVFDCASAAINSARLGVPNGEFNLGSTAPPTVRDLLRDLIKYAKSRSVLLNLPAGPLKAVLRFLDRLNAPLLVPEQFEIADEDFVLDIRSSINELKWYPMHSDLDMMISAYDEFSARSPA